MLRIALGRASAHELLDFADVEFLEDCGTPQRAVKALSRQGQEEVPLTARPQHVRIEDDGEHDWADRFRRTAAVQQLCGVRRAIE